MRYPTESEPNLSPLIEAAQREPVYLERDRQEVAVIVSAREFARLSKAANQDFQDFCDSVSDNAAAQGLTESKLNDLLNHA